MLISISWQGFEAESREQCLIRAAGSGWDIRSEIRSIKEDLLVGYRMLVNASWEATRFQLAGRYRGQALQLKLQRESRGHWRVNGQRDSRFDDCIDIDLPLTPFTNTLPIKRLGLAAGAQQEITVIYADVLGPGIRAARQRYTRRSDDIYHYENVPNDFEADIRVDSFGLVLDYPGLFTARSIRQCDDL